MSEKDEANLLAIMEASEKIIQFSSSFPDADAFLEDARSFDACMMNFVVIGETATKLSDSLKQVHKHISWSKIKALRNIVAHDYFGIDAEEVWQIIQKHIPKLISDLKQILP